MNPLAGACFVFGMSDMQFCEAQVRAVKAKTESLVIRFRSAKRNFAEPGQSVLIDVGTEKSELLVNNRLRAHPLRGPDTTPTSTQMMKASFPVVSVAKVRNVQQPK